MASLRGRDLVEKHGKLVIKYRRKEGKCAGREVGEPDVYQALKDYLEKAGRGSALKGSGAKSLPVNGGITSLCLVCQKNLSMGRYRLDS